MFKLLFSLAIFLFSLNALSEASFINKINRVLDENIERKGISKTISIFLESQPGEDKALLSADCYYGNRMLAHAIEEQAILIDKKYFNQTYILINKELSLINFLLPNCSSLILKEQVKAIKNLKENYTKYIKEYNNAAKSLN